MTKMGRAAVLVLAVFAGCSQPPKPHSWRPHHGRTQPSSERANPTTFVLGDEVANGMERTRTATLGADVPGSGDWWFAFESSDVGHPATVSVYAYVDAGGSVELIDDANTSVQSSHETGNWMAQVESGERKRRWLLHVTTAHAIMFDVGAEQTWRVGSADPPEDPQPPEPPRCNANAPDYTNPRCCAMPGCRLGAERCHAKVVAIAADRRTIEIDRGADQELMYGALGRVHVNQQVVASGTVTAVGNVTATITLDEPLAAAIEAGSVDVSLRSPLECQRR